VVWHATAPSAGALLGAGVRISGLRVAVDGPDAAPVAQALAAAGADAGLLVTSVDPAPPDPLPAWLVVGASECEDVAALAFRLKTLTSDLRARRDGVRIGLEAPAELLDRLSRDDVAAYVDFVVVRPGEPVPATMPDVWQRRDGPVISLDALARLPSDGTTVLLDWPQAAGIPLAWAALGSVLGPEPVATPGAAPSCATDGREAACRVRSFLERGTRDRLVWVDADEAVETVAGIAGPAIGATALDGQPLAVRAPQDPPDRVVIDPPSRSFVLRLSPAAAEDEARFQEAVDVAAERSLTAAEILARHRAAEQGRRRRVPRLVASGDTTIAFTLPGLSAPSTITARTVLYEDGSRREVEYEDLRWNGTTVALDGGRVPRLPIVEPAAAEPPLAIRLNEAYSYRLQGREDVGGRPAYVLSFEPRTAGGARGQAWIDAADFGLSRLATIRDGLPGPIVASEQRDWFLRMDVGGRPAWLLERSEIHQAYEGPGHHTSIHRLVRFERIEPNPPDFQSRRATAHAGSGVLMRETSDGFRYLSAQPGGGERRPAGKKDSVRTLALGVTLDPNVDGPLPFAGIGYLDLDLFGTGTQVNSFLGLGFVQGSFTVPRLGRTRWQAHGALLAVFVRYNDRAFREGVEIYPETLRQRPSRLSLGVSRPLTSRSRLRLLYELEHNALGRSDLTAPEFQEPVSPLAHGARVELELRRGAWTGVLFGSAARRTHWEAWGARDAVESGGGDYQRYGVSLARSLVSSPRATGRLEASWMDGHGLDRFSRYAIDSFLNRLRGYPAGSLRYDRGLLLRGQGSWAPLPGLRTDLFLDAGFLHDPGYGDDLQWYPGVGVGLELALPHGALLVAEGGYGVAGRDRDGRKGTQALQITLVKTF
jgi:nucleotide-binding universal stress UspA family protein